MESVERYAIVRNNPVTNEIEYWREFSNEFVQNVLNPTHSNAVQNITLWPTRDLAEQVARALQAKTPNLGIAPIEITASVGDVLPVTEASHRKLD